MWFTPPWIHGCLGQRTAVAASDIEKDSVNTTIAMNMYARFIVLVTPVFTECYSVRGVIPRERIIALYSSCSSVSTSINFFAIASRAFLCVVRTSFARL